MAAHDRPQLLSHFDARWKNGFGVMMDDIAAALHTLLVLALAQRMVNWL